MKLLHACVRLLATLVASISVVAVADKPNIILIMADDLGYETLGTYGGASYETPRLDELAATGMKFTHCYSQPLCTPSRVKLMTGQYNFRNYTHFGVLPKGEITFGHLLQDAGYATGIVGKWQLYGHNSERAQAQGLGQMPDEAGFDDFLMWQIKKDKRAGERYADPLLHEMGEEPKRMLGAYGPDLFADFVEQFMRDHRDEPFFVYYPMALTHDPFVPTPDSAGWGGDRYERNSKYFADMVAYTDHIVGRIVDALDELGLRENTLLLFVGDNGTHRSIRSTMKDGRIIAGNKGNPDDAGTRVPFIANWPGTVPAGRVNDDLIDFSDFLPTLVEVAGANLPEENVVDGKSFAEQLVGGHGTPREWIFCDYDPRWGDWEPSRFARNRRWKLYDDERFYDVLNDVLEATPLSVDALAGEALEVRRMLQQVLDYHVGQ